MGGQGKDYAWSLLILDLRGNPGGPFGIAVQVAPALSCSGDELVRAIIYPVDSCTDWWSALLAYHARNSRSSALSGRAAATPAMRKVTGF